MHNFEIQKLLKNRIFFQKFLTKTHLKKKSDLTCHKTTSLFIPPRVTVVLGFLAVDGEMLPQTPMEIVCNMQSMHHITFKMGKNLKFSPSWPIAGFGVRNFGLPLCLHSTGHMSLVLGPRWATGLLRAVYKGCLGKYSLILASHVPSKNSITIGQGRLDLGA